MMQYGGGIRRLRRAQEGGPKDTLIYPPGDSEYMNQPPLNYDILQMLDNKRKLEYNDYMRDQRDPTNINNAPPAYRERFLAKPKTVQAQEGMQQPSEEEMMMMQQQQGQQEQQQQPQQSGQDQQMMQIMQQVAEALQQGAEPEELTVELLQGQVSPEAIMQIFAQLGMPEEQVQQLVMGVIQQMQGGQEQDPRQQQMSEEEMMAMQQQDPRQMQQAPMAAYGMSMGGYDMPFYDDPYEMAYGGLPKYETGTPSDHGNRDRGTKIKKIGNKEYENYKGTVYRDKQGEYKRIEGTSGANVKLKPRGTVVRGGPGYTKEDVCAWMTKVGGSYYGVGAQEMVDKGLTSASNLEYLKGCELKATDDEEVYTESGDKPPCLCKKTDGSLYKDAQGNTKEAPIVDGVCQ